MWTFQETVFLDSKLIQTFYSRCYFHQKPYFIYSTRTNIDLLIQFSTRKVYHRPWFLRIFLKMVQFDPGLLYNFMECMIIIIKLSFNTDVKSDLIQVKIKNLKGMMYFKKMSFIEGLKWPLGMILIAHQ